MKLVYTDNPRWYNDPVLHLPDSFGRPLCRAGSRTSARQYNYTTGYEPTCKKCFKLFKEQSNARNA